MSVVQFRTPGTIPLEAFDTMGMSAKVGDHPIGRFGTGLKYAIAVILRNHGQIRLFRDGTEYEFYLSKKSFRGVEFEHVRLRKKNGLGKWMTSRKMPFTTQLGRDWQLWQAYRELESNTRDEGGETVLVDHPSMKGPESGTMIEVDCRGFSQCVEDENVFLDTDRTERVFRSPKVDIYDTPSRYLYYRGIRVYELRYPSLYTYDFGEGVVTLTEDRTMGNVWSCMWDLAYTIQTKVEDETILDRILAKTDNACFENYELNFGDNGSDYFRQRVRVLSDMGRLGRSSQRYQSEYLSMPDPEPTTKIEMLDKDWETLLGILDEQEDNLDAVQIADKIREQL